MKTKFLSCAKLNLDLKILEKQSNGLHAISSSMQFIDLYDEITIELENNITYELQVQGNIDCSSSSNLVTKAHKALQEVTNQNLPCKIYLKKNIPVQSGLGGGSSNAATTLLALNSLFKLKLSGKELVQIGHMLGSDVPFFIRSQSGIISGTGELFTPKEFPLKDFSLLVPNIKSSTEELFDEFDKENKSSLPEENANDFNKVFFRKFSNVKSKLIELNIQNLIRLSGTGSTIFFEDKNFNTLSKIAEKIPPNWRSFKCKALQYSPIYELWGVAKR